MRRSLLLALLLAGCSGPEARPLDPARMESEFRARRLDDPSLVDYLRTHGLETPPVWELDALTLAAFYYHPDLDVARARLLGAAGAERSAGEVPNPTLNVDLEKVLGSTPAGVSPWITGFSLQMPIDFLWKRGYRLDEAKAKQDASRLELAETAWRVRRRLRSALLEEVLARRDADLRQRELQFRTELATAADRLLAAGETSRLEADRARVELAVARVAQEESKGRASTTRSALAQAIGVPVTALAAVRIDWPDVETLPEPPREVQQAGLLNRLDVRRGLADYAAAEAALGLEVAKSYPDVTLGPGYLFDQGDKKFTIGLSVSLPIFNQNGGPIAEAEAKRKEAGARFLALQAQAIGEFDQAAARYQAARAQGASLTEALAAIRRRAEGVRRAVELGDLDRAAMLGIQVEGAVLDAALLEALRRAQEALGALEDAVQRPVGRSFELPVKERR